MRGDAPPAYRTESSEWVFAAVHCSTLGPPPGGLVNHKVICFVVANSRVHKKGGVFEMKAFVFAFAVVLFFVF